MEHGSDATAAHLSFQLSEGHLYGDIRPRPWNDLHVHGVRMHIDDAREHECVVCIQQLSRQGWGVRYGADLADLVVFDPNRTSGNDPVGCDDLRIPDQEGIHIASVNG